MKQGITITREYDHHDRPVVRITKRRGKLTLEEVSDLLRTEGWGEWNGYYAIVLNCSEGTLGGNGLYGYEEPKGDALDLYPLENFGDCPVCGQMTPPFQYCPNCGASWKEMDDTVEKRLAAMREETEREIRKPSLTPEAVQRILDAFDNIIEAINRMIEWAAQAIRTLADFFGETLDNFILRRAPPKWRHYALHAKRARVRKKYRNRIRRAFFAALASEGGGSS